MTRRTKLTEEQWAEVVATAGRVSLPSILAPVRASSTPEDSVAEGAALSDVEGWSTAAGLLATAETTIDLLASRGEQRLFTASRARGWFARLAIGDDAYAGAVRSLNPGRNDTQVGIIPGIELSQQTGPSSHAALIEDTLRLLPDLHGESPDPRTIEVPRDQVATAIAAVRERDPATREALLEQLGWTDLPDEVAGLDRISGDATLTLTTPGRRTRIIRLLHGRDGWINMSINHRSLRYRAATAAWLRAELTWELASAAEVAR